MCGDLALPESPSSPFAPAWPGDPQPPLVAGDDSHGLHTAAGGQCVQVEAPYGCQADVVSGWEGKGGEDRVVERGREQRSVKGKGDKDDGVRGDGIGGKMEKVMDVR